MIGVIVTSFDEKAKHLVKDLRENYDRSVVLFCTQLCFVDDCSLPTLPVADIWKFPESVIATDETGTRFLESCPVPLTRYTLCNTIESSLPNFYEDNNDQN